MTTQAEKTNFLQFETIDEPWNTYNLEDGSILRIRIILSGLLKEDGDVFYLRTTNVFNVVPNVKYVGVPSPPLKSNEKLDNYIEADDLKILEKTDKWNEYNVPSENITLSVRGELVSVSRTSRHDDRGIPIYSTNVQLLVKPKKKKK